MYLKGVIEEDFVNYKLPCTTLMFPNCSFKCGKANCQNSSLVTLKMIQVDDDELIKRYINNPIPKAICCQGLEPFDSKLDLFNFIDRFRRKYKRLDDIVIYTGYTEEELSKELYILKMDFKNIIIKFGRYIPNQKGHFDKLLQVHLSSDNQYAKNIDDIKWEDINTKGIINDRKERL